MANKEEKSSNIKLKPIKLIVKKPSDTKKKTLHDHKNIIRKNNEMYFIDMFSSIKIVLIAILVIAIILLAINIYRESQNKPPIFNFSSQKSGEKNGLFSNWQTINGYTFTFERENIFYIYESGSDVNNNYFEGRFTYLEGEEAIKEMGYDSFDDFKKSIVIADVKNVYSIHMIPTKYIKNNLNIINRKIEENEKWWFIMILTTNDEAIAYNKTLDIRYKLTRN